MSLKNFNPPPNMEMLGVQILGSYLGALSSLCNYITSRLCLMVHVRWMDYSYGILNATDPQVIYNQEILQFVKSHFL